MNQRKKSIIQRIPLVLTFHSSIPNFHIILKKSGISFISITNLKIYCEKPIIAHLRNKNLKDIIGSTKIANNQVVH